MAYSHRPIDVAGHVVVFDTGNFAFVVTMEELAANRK